MAVLVVHALEAVEVDEEQGDGLALAPAQLEEALRRVAEQRSVGQSRERVVLRPVFGARDHLRGARERASDFVRLGEAERRHRYAAAQCDLRRWRGEAADRACDAPADQPGEGESQRKHERGGRGHVADALP